MEEESMPKIVVRPYIRPIGSHLKDSFRLILRHWAPLLVTQAIVFFITIFAAMVAVVIVVTPVGFGVIRGMDGQDILRYIFTSYFWIGMAVFIVPTIVAAAWGYAAMISALGYKGDGTAPIGPTLKKGFQLLVPFLGLILAVCFAYIGGWVMLIFPAVILWIGLSLAWYIIVLEDVSVWQAIGTSWYITKGYKWSIFGRFILIGLILWVVVVVLAMWSMVPIMGLATMPVQLACNFVIAPYVLAFFYCIYGDIRSVRQDIYPMKGGISVFMIACWIVGIAACVGIVLAIIYLLQQYIL